MRCNDDDLDALHTCSCREQPVHLRVHVSTVASSPTASITLRARHTVLRKQEQAGKGTAVRSRCVIEMQDPSSDAIYSYLSATVLTCPYSQFGSRPRLSVR